MFLLLLVCLAAFAGAASAQVGTYSVIAFPPNTQCVGISDSGYVVGRYTNSNATFRWKNGITHTLPAGWGVEDVDDSGTVAGYYIVNDIAYPARYIHNTTDVLTSQLPYASALDINRSDDIALGSESEPLVFLNGSVVNYGQPPLNDNSGILAINDAGHVTASGTSTTPYERHSYLKDGTGWHLLQYAGSFIIPQAINNLDEVAATGFDASGAVPLLVRNGVYIPLTSQYGGAVDVNDSSVVVGSYSHVPGQDYNAFMWRDGVLTDLDDLMAFSTGWHFKNAAAINNKGWIVGDGSLNGGPTRGFLLRPSPIVVLAPEEDKRVRPAQPDTIRWVSAPGVANVNIYVSYDYKNNSSATLQTLASGVPASQGQFVWIAPDTALADAVVLVEDALDENVAGLSGFFDIKGWRLTRPMANGAYEAYLPGRHGWTFSNATANMWPSAWYAGFNYQTGIDARTGETYSRGFNASVFQAAPSQRHIDWQLFVDVFGQGNCYWSLSPPIYGLRATMKWGALGNYNGACAGFATTSLLAFGVPASLAAEFPSLPPFADLANLPLSGATRTAVNNMWARQLGATHTADLAARILALPTPNTTLQALKDLFDADAVNIGYLRLSNVNSGPAGSHAVVPWKVEPDTTQPGNWWVHIHDSNFPMQDTRVVVNTTGNSGQGTWSYTGLPGWGGAYGMLLREAVATFLADPDLGFTSPAPAGASGTDAFAASTIPGGMDILSGDASQLLIQSGAGTIGHTGTTMTTSLPGAVPLDLETGTESPPYGYALPAGSYKLTLDSPGTHHRVAFMRQGECMEYVSHGASGPDRLDFDGALTVRGSGTGGQRTAELTAALTASGRDRVFRLADFNLHAGDSLEFDLVGSDFLEVENMGPAQSLTLEVGLAQSTNGVRLRYGTVQFPANSKSQIVPQNWFTLPSQPLEVYVDNGRNGSYDGFYTLTGAVVEVAGEASSLRPGLLQPSPNPFVTSTRLSWRLAGESDVVVDVYDIQGRLVARLAERREGAGLSSVTWNGRDRNGRSVGSGVYVIRFTATPANGGVRMRETRRIVRVQ